MPTHEQYLKEKAYHNAKSRAYYWSHPHIRQKRCTDAADIRHRARLLVGRGVIRCSNCGCDDERVIEINHMNGGGKSELGEGPQQFCREIVFGKRTIDDLDLRCKLCNELHYILRRFGALPFRVIWKSG